MRKFDALFQKARGPNPSTLYAIFLGSADYLRLRPDQAKDDEKTRRSGLKERKNILFPHFCSSSLYFLISASSSSMRGDSCPEPARTHSCFAFCFSSSTFSLLAMVARLSALSASSCARLSWCLRALSASMAATAAASSMS